MKENYVVSFSGGRTSAYLVWLFESSYKSKYNIEYVFCDTGAEHPKTYKFIRDVVSNFSINLTCLRASVNPEFGIGTTYTVVSIDDIGPDLKPFMDVSLKYGTPSVGAPRCTNEMKSIPSDKYCNEKYGRGNYTKWLGIRIDEPRRIKIVDKQLDIFGESKRIDYSKIPLRYLGQISDFTKEDVLDFWEGQDFNLEITEELGNCVFCVKKGNNKIALAAKREPELAAQFIEMINLPEMPIREARSSRGLNSEHM